MARRGPVEVLDMARDRCKLDKGLPSFPDQDCECKYIAPHSSLIGPLQLSKRPYKIRYVSKHLLLL